ncbi:Ferredoxin [Psychrobacter arenosus]
MTYSVGRALVMVIYKGNEMSLKLQPSMTQSPRDLEICKDYWAYDPTTNYIEHVESVCRKYRMTAPALFKEVSECFAYLDDVRCEYCGYICPVELPADIPYMRSRESWCCEVCEYATWQEYYGR